jgi:Phosducin
VESRILTELWRLLAVKYGDVKFCEMRADLCIEGYPERNTPTVLIYKDGDIRRQLVTLGELNGVKTALPDLERVLVEVGAVKEGDVRLKRRDSQEDDDDSNRRRTTIKNTARRKDDEDDDWD